MNAALRVLLPWLACHTSIGTASAQFRQDLPPPLAGSGRLVPSQMGVVANDRDPASIEVAEYYAAARRIPARNLLRVSLPTGKRIRAGEFAALRSRIDAHFGPDVEALVLVWTMPYQVECQSITGAVSLGLDPGLCRQTCGPGRPSPYFDYPGDHPFRRLGFRPSMLLPATDVELAKTLINRGIAADRSRPSANAFFLVTSDRHRSSRAQFFPPSGTLTEPPLRISTLRQDAIEHEKDVMFYLTGMASVPGLETIGFLPGALADHLTSFGGDLARTSLTTGLDWLGAGATATYGTVTEPCNHWQKFPNPAVLLKHYVRGGTAIEAYWKSVAWPAQGLFIGEPLAAPYGR